MVHVIFWSQNHSDIKGCTLFQWDALRICSLPIQRQCFCGRSPRICCCIVIRSSLGTKLPLEVYLAGVAIGDHQLPCRRIANGSDEILPQCIPILVIQRSTLWHIGLIPDRGGVPSEIVQIRGTLNGIS